jgi:hypothetical protein
VSVVITSAEQVTPDWLTDVLRRSGTLDSARGVSVTAKSYHTNMATAMPLEIVYVEFVAEHLVVCDGAWDAGI